MRIALCQNDSRLGDKAGQMAALCEAAAAAGAQGAHLLVFPELFMTGYNLGPRIVELAEPRDGDFMRRVQDIARQHNLCIAYGYPELDGRVYNSAAVVSASGELLANQRKLHLAPGEYERSVFSAGDEFAFFEVAGLRAALLICYDVEFPEAVRSCAKRNVDLLVVPTALRQEYAHLTRTLIPTRAFENRLFVAYVNYAGAEQDWLYCGMSCVAGPDGHLVAQCEQSPAVLVTDIEPEALAVARKSIAYLQDLRESIYL